jgi:predicted metal-dependent hydrolase
MVLQIRPATDEVKKQAVLDQWYRTQLREAALPLIAKWEPLLGVKVQKLFVQQMKTRWGSCNPASASVRLNTDLAKKPRECLEYMVVHELVHLLEPTHNKRFVALMDRFLPEWQFSREVLNRLPVRHENWAY